MVTFGCELVVLATSLREELASPVLMLATLFLPVMELVLRRSLPADTADSALLRTDWLSSERSERSRVCDEPFPNLKKLGGMAANVRALLRAC